MKAPPPPPPPPQKEATEPEEPQKQQKEERGHGLAPPPPPPHLPLPLHHHHRGGWGTSSRAHEAPDPASGEKRHFHNSDYDALEKERLAARKFGHVRHDVYKNVIQPYDPTSLSYAPEHERLRKDVDVFVTLDHKNTQSKKQVILESHISQRSQRERRLAVEREVEWAKCRQHDAWTRTEHPHARVLANRTSVPYNPINLKYHDDYNGERARFIDASTRWRAAMRTIRIHKKINGDKNYDVISWQKIPTLKCPEKPTPPSTTKEPAPVDLLTT